MYKSSLKYFRVGIYLRCEKVTSTSSPIVICIGKYGNMFLLEFFSMMLQQDLNIMYNKVVKLNELYFCTKNYF